MNIKTVALHTLQISLVSLVLGFGLNAQAAVKLGYVDVQEVIQSTGAGKKARKQLEKIYRQKKQELKEKEDALKQMSQDLQKKSLAMSEDVKAKKQAEFQMEMRKYQQIVGQSQMEMKKKEQELTEPIVEKVQKVIRDIAEKENYTMIFNKSEQNVLWAENKVDLTQRVIKECDKK